MITSFLSYLLKVACLLASFYLLYLLLMRRETLYRLNRTVLLSSMVLSLFLPLCRITIHKEATAGTSQYEQHIMVPQVLPDAVGKNSDIVTYPIEVPDAVPMTETTISAQDERVPGHISWQQALCIVWLIGVAVCIIKLAGAIYSIKRIIKSGRITRVINGIRIVVTHSNINPFSWMNNIVISENDYESPNADAIIAHELSHVKSGHSWDMLVTDLYAAIQWFNPVIYNLRQSLQEVHEYQADNSVIRHGYDTRSYQLMLLGKLAMDNGYRIANNFSKKNLSNRISMMNKKNSPFARAWKALFVPVLTGLFLDATAVIVYDCKPAPSQVKDADFAKLQEYYGQAAFIAANYKTYNIKPDADHKIAKVSAGGSPKAEKVAIEDLQHYFKQQENYSKIRVNICLEDWHIEEKDDGNPQILNELKPLLSSLENIGIRSLVVSHQYELNEIYYSTYKYARIYETGDKGQYEMVHNDLSVYGNASYIKEWINLLDIQYVAFYTIDLMPMSDVATIMDAAKARGVMTFIACRPDSPATRAEYGDKALKALKQSFPFHATILPVKRDLNKEFKGMTLREVTNTLEYEYTGAYLDKKPEKIIGNPRSFSCDTWFQNMKLYLFKDELIMLLNPVTMSRNSWCRPDDVVLLVDGKEYRLLKQEGFQNFSDYPWVTADNYANGSLCWGPDYASMYTTLHFEPIPLDSRYMDILQNECREYAARGVMLTPIDDRHPFLGTPYENIASIPALGSVTLNDIPAGSGTVATTRIEFSKDKTDLVLDLRIQAPFTYMGYLGSDLTLKVKKTGKSYKIQGVEGGILDRDFDRGGDHVFTTIHLSFPVIEPNDIISKMSQNDINRRTPTSNGADEMKTMTLEGTICHQKVSIPITVPRIEK